MKNKQTKLLFEGWRNFLNEAEAAPAAGQDQTFNTLDQLVDKKYPEFVQGLQQLISNPEFRKLLTTANPSDADNKLNVQEATFKCTELQPMQNVIGLDDSLLFDLQKPNKVEQKSSGTVLGPEIYDFKSRPIITCGKYIVDGHHRWSTCYMLNPNNSLKVQNITNFKDGTSALKASQLIIAAIKGKVPISKPKGINVYASDPVSISQWISKSMSDAFVKAYAPAAKKIRSGSIEQNKNLQEAETAPSSTVQQKQANKLASNIATGKIDPNTGKPVAKKEQTPSAQEGGDKKLCVDALMANILLLKKNNAPKGDAAGNPRTIMPQFADEGPAAELQAAIKGTGVNVSAIKKAIAEGKLDILITKLVQEELNKLK
jgi:hypothetical protein